MTSPVTLGQPVNPNSLIQSHIVDPKVQQTNKKIHQAVILGWVFIGLGILFAAASFVVGFMVSPIAFVGLAPAVALTVLGILWLQKQAVRRPSEETSSNEVEPIEVKKIDEKKSVPFVPGQPLGLNNGGANCWLNSILQVVFNSPHLEACIQAQKAQFPIFVKALDTYNKAKNDSSHCKIEWVAPIDTQAIREEIVHYAATRNGCQISSNAGDQEDATEGLPLLFSALTDAFKATSTLFTPSNRQNFGTLQAADAREIPFIGRLVPEGVDNQIIIKLGKSTILPFQKALENVFDYVTDSVYRLDQEDAILSGVLPQPVQNLHTRVSYERHPGQFFVQVSRSYTLPKKGPNGVQLIDRNGSPITTMHKNSKEFDVPYQLTLPERALPIGDYYQYQLKSFIVHAGYALNSGHYISYIKDAQNRWWKCDDSLVEPAAKEEVDAQRKLGVSYYYEAGATAISRIPQTPH